MIRFQKTLLVSLLMISMMMTCYHLHAQRKSIQLKPRILPLDTAVTTGRLANGFTYFIRYNEEPKDRVVFYLVNKVGSILEDDNQRGLAHFMEHMSFNGTKHYPKNELVDYLQRAGIRFGSDLNAYTSYNETVYQLPVPSDKPEMVQNGLQIIRDWAQDALLDSDEINSERGVVLEEKRRSKGADERMSEKTMPITYNHSRYADRLTIGTDDVLNHFEPETIRQFYHDWYRPDLQAIIVVGDIDVKEMEAMIKNKFSDLQNPSNEKKRIDYSIPLTDRNQFLAITDPEQTQTSVQVLIKHPGHKIQTGEDYKNLIIRSLFNDMIGNRCSELAKKENSPFLGVSAGADDYLGNLAVFGVSVDPKPGELSNAFQAAWKEIERIKQNGFTQGELDRAKQNYLSRLQSLYEERNKTNSRAYVEEYVQYFLNGTTAPGIATEYKLTKQFLKEINVQSVDAFAKEMIAGTNRDILVYAPQKEEKLLPDESRMTGWIASLSKEKLTPYREEGVKGNLLALRPAGGQIISRSYDAHQNITTLSLGNGVKVLLKPTKFRNDQISFNGFSPGGTSLYSDSDYQSASAANMISSFGVGNFTQTKLNKLLSGKQVYVNPYIGERWQGVSGSTDNKNAETALQLVYAYFTAPRKDTVMFNNIMSGMKADLLNRNDDPQTVFGDTVNAVLSNHSWRKSAPSLDKINQVKLVKAYDIYRERFADASGFTFVFVGSIDTATLEPIIAKYLGSLPSLHKQEEAKDLHIHIPEGRIERTVYKGSEPLATVYLVLSGDYHYNMPDNIRMDALTEALQIRLIEQLREKEGGVYSPQVNINTSKYPQPRFSLIIAFNCAPQNADTLMASALQEIDSLKQYGPGELDVDKYKAQEHNAWQMQLQNNGFWLSYLTSKTQNQEDFTEADDHLKEVDALTSDGLQKMAKKYFTGDNLIRLVLLPEKK